MVKLKKIVGSLASRVAAAHDVIAARAIAALTVDGVSIHPSQRHHFALRWYFDGKPTLYFDGKRVTNSWRLCLDVSVPKDVEGTSANTA